MSDEAEPDVPDVRQRSPLDRFAAWLGPPRGYQLTRWLVLRLLGFIYVFAFIGLIVQGPPLLGEHGLTPVAPYLDRLREGGAGFWEAPSVLWLGASDGVMAMWAWIGLGLSLAVLIGYANLPILFALWVIYGSFVRVGQLWFSFGWEIQILETTLLAALLAHPWDPRPLRAPSPPTASLVLMRWLVFRIMLGAGLIKLRGDPCWRDFTCLDAHFETQPIPNPLSAWFHDLPHSMHALGVAFNHLVEVVLPVFVFGPRRLRLFTGCAMAAFQIVLIASGSLAFLNWLTLVPILALFDDEFLLQLVPSRPRAWLKGKLAAPTARDPKQLAIAFGATLVLVFVWSPLPGSVQLVTAVAAVVGAAAFAWRKRLDGHLLLVGAFAAIIAIESVPVIANLASSHQAMNRSYDRFDLVNTYGAFGSVGLVRHELVIEGTRDLDPATATWQAYELPCKPGDLARRPCILGPYHRRLDWLIWFAAMYDRPHDPWLIHLVYKLLDGDTMVRRIIATDPFDGAMPTYVRIRRFVYHLQPLGADDWWTRDSEEVWLEPVALDTPGLIEALEPYGWPSTSVSR